MLIASFWEAYCEDIAAEALEHIVVHASAADALPKKIKKIIAAKLKADRNELAIWSISDDRWRAEGQGQYEHDTSTQGIHAGNSRSARRVAD